MPKRGIPQQEMEKRWPIDRFMEKGDYRYCYK